MKHTISEGDKKRLLDRVPLLVLTNFELAREALKALSNSGIEDAEIGTKRQFYSLFGFLENQLQHFTKAADWYEKSISLFKPKTETSGLAETLLDYAGVLTNLREWEKLEKRLEQINALLQKKPAENLQARYLLRIGFLNLQSNRLDSAMEQLLESERVLKSLGDTADKKDYYFLTLTLDALGELYERVDKREKSVEKKLESLQVAENQELITRLAYFYFQAGRALMPLERLKEAIVCFEKTVHLAGEAEANLRANAQANIGQIAFLQKDYAAANALFDKALNGLGEPETSEDFSNIAHVISLKAKIFTETGDTKQAQFYLESAVHFGEKGNEMGHLAQICYDLAEIYAQNKEFEKAFRFKTDAYDLLSNHASKTRQTELLKLEARHELETRRQQVRLAQLQLTGLQLRALRAQMNPHFLFNALNAIQGFITSGRSDEAEIQLARFAKLMRRTLDYTGQEKISLEAEIEFLEQYLDLNKKLRFRNNFSWTFELDEALESEVFHIPTMILQPFIENAIEHGLRPKQGGHLKFSFELVENGACIRCCIEDDGIGFNKSREKHLQEAAYQKHKSKGMEITRERLNLLHAQSNRSGHFINISDLAENIAEQKTGTLVEILLPIVL